MAVTAADRRRAGGDRGRGCALCRAERGPPGRCPLDVWWQYPTPAEPERRPSRLPFHEVPNVLITPHSSSSTEATADRRWSAVAANLDPLDARADAAQPEGPHRMGGTGSTGSWTSGCQSRASFTRGPTTASPSNIQGGSRMRECRTSGSVRGAPSNEHPYRNPLASGTPLVAMISVPICARIDPLDPIGPPPCRGRSGDLHRPSPSTLSGSACPSRRCRDIDRATDATNPVSQLSCAGIIVVPTTGREKNPGRGGCPF